MNLLLVWTINETAVIVITTTWLVQSMDLVDSAAVVKLCVNFPLLGVPNETVCVVSPMVVDALVERGRDHLYYYCYYVIVVIMLCVLEYAVATSVPDLCNLSLAAERDDRYT